MPSSTNSSACSFTSLCTKSVHFCGSIPAAMKSTNISRSEALMMPGSWYCVVRACQSALKK